MASSAISRSIRWDYHFTHCTKANITDDQGLIELLSHNLDYFREASQHSKITILLDHGYHPDTLQKALQALYPQVMSKIASLLRSQQKPKSSTR